MKKKIAASTVLTLLLSSSALPQAKPQSDDQPIRISTQLVQLDVVVTDKTGRVVTNLGKDDFELYDSGRKQQINFFEFVDAGKQRRVPEKEKKQPGQEVREEAGRQGVSEKEVRRIFAFVIDDLTIRYEDLTNIREMLTNFVENQMAGSDLVAIVRTVGGKGLLQQFTTDKDLLRRAIRSLTPSLHPFSVFHNPDVTRVGNPQAFVSGEEARGSDSVAASGEEIDITSAGDDANKTLRAYMSLGTASFVIDSVKTLPGRKTLVLVSGGLPILSSAPGTTAGNIAYFLNSLSDKATRAGVAISTMDVRGLQAYTGVASFEDTPGKSSMGAGRSGGFGRTIDNTQLGDRNPFDQMEGHQGLRVLAAETGGIAVLNKNDFNAGLEKIINTSDGYYLLAYTPLDTKFKGDFRKVDVKVRGKDLKVYSRRGYFAREDAPAPAPITKQDQVLAAIKSPLARRDIDLDAMLVYKAAQQNQGAIDISIVVDPGKLQFDMVGGKQQASYDVDGFVFDEFGKLRGGFSETVTATLVPNEYSQALKAGLSYSAHTTLPAGTYQIRLAVRDNNNSKVGTISRYIEVPDLSKGKFTASSLLIGAAPPGDVAPEDLKSGTPMPLSANRRISRKQDLRYAVLVYNAKLKDGKPQVRTQLIISQNGQVIFREPEQQGGVAGSSSQLIKVGQLGLSKVKPGRYTLSLLVIDPQADKKAQPLVRSMDFVVID